MPPKANPAAKEKAKADAAKKQKVVEDKTFGLKNKNKSKNVQKYVQSLQQSAQPRPKKIEDDPKAAAKVRPRLCLFFILCFVIKRKNYCFSSLKA